MEITACSRRAPPCRAVSIVYIALSSVSIQFLTTSVCSQLLALFYFLQPTDFTMHLAKHMAPPKENEKSRIVRQASILLHIVVYVFLGHRLAVRECSAKVRPGQPPFWHFFFLIYNKRTVADCTPALPLTCSQSLLCLFERWKKLQFTLLQESIILEEKNQAAKRHLSHVAPLTFIWR